MRGWPDEQRIAWDGQPYTQEQFCEYYGADGNAWWRSARRMAEERRIAWDGQPYTQQQFCEFYGDVANAWWEAACPIASAPQPGVTTVTETPAQQPQESKPLPTIAGATQVGASPVESQHTTPADNIANQCQEVQEQQAIVGASQPGTACVGGQDTLHLHSTDLSWLTDPRVEQLKVDFSTSLLKLKVFAEAHEEVMSIWGKLSTLTEFHGVFAKMMGLAQQRMQAAQNADQLMAELEKEQVTLEKNWNRLNTVALQVQEELESRSALNSLD